MNYCTRCGKPTNNGIMCEDCLILGSPWLSAMKRKENDLEEELAELKFENADLRERLDKAERRAEVAEREAIILSKWLADKTRKDYPYQAWLEAAQKQAKKELAEEGK